MDNQHKLIKGYRDLTQEEIDMMNKIKTLANHVQDLVTDISLLENTPDPRWLSIGVTDLQKGFMSLTRSIAKPESF